MRVKDKKIFCALQNFQYKPLDHKIWGLQHHLCFMIKQLALNTTEFRLTKLDDEHTLSVLGLRMCYDFLELTEREFNEHYRVFASI